MTIILISVLIYLLLFLVTFVLGWKAEPLHFWSDKFMHGLFMAIFTPLTTVALLLGVAQKRKEDQEMSDFRKHWDM